MKKRTRVTAWVMLILTGMMLAWTVFGWPPGLRFSGHDWQSDALGLTILGAWSSLWIFLLRRRVWAWWVLTVFYCALALLTLYGVALTPSYWLARDNTLARAMFMTMFKLVIGSIDLLALLFLLTDRPGGWRQVAREQEG